MPSTLSDWPVSKQHCHPESSYGRGTPQKPESPRADMKNVPRIDREEGRRATEEHGKKIERDGSENHWLNANERDTGND